MAAAFDVIATVSTPAAVTETSAVAEPKPCTDKFNVSAVPATGDVPPVGAAYVIENAPEAILLNSIAAKSAESAMLTTPPAVPSIL